MKTKHLNLNSQIKVKLTDYGKDIYYHQFDELSALMQKKGLAPIEQVMPQVDEHGYTKFQLWEFIHLYGNYIGIAMPDVIMPIDIVFEYDDVHDDFLQFLFDHIPPNEMEKYVYMFDDKEVKDEAGKSSD